MCVRGRDWDSPVSFRMYMPIQIPHDYPNHWVKQQYLPDDLKDTRYYAFGANKLEQAAKVYWEQIKKEEL